jgi:hypothetical protein
VSSCCISKCVVYNSVACHNKNNTCAHTPPRTKTYTSQVCDKLQLEFGRNHKHASFTNKHMHEEQQFSSELITDRTLDHILTPYTVTH